MFAILFSHNWKEKTRSSIWAKNVLANIFLGLAALMLLSYALLLGFFLAGPIEELIDVDPIAFVNRGLLYYFFFEFFLRFFLQNVPVQDIEPYLHLPIKKGRIVHYMLRKSQISVFNLLAILIFTPFAFIRIGGEYGAFTGFMYWVMIIGASFSVHFKTIYFKKKLNDIPNLFIILLLVILVIGGLDYYSIFSFSDFSLWIFNQILAQPLLALVFPLSWFLTYRICYAYFVKNTYPEELSTKKGQTKIRGDFGFLKRFGRIGELIGLELKLILRHKRPRTALILSGVFLLYGLVFYPQEAYQQMDWIFLFVGIFVTGIFFINHGQFLLSWESGYFDFVLTRKTNYRQYIEAKYYMFVVAAAIAFVCSLAYGFFGIKIILINLAAFLFNIGINIPLVMRIAMNSPKRIDLNKGAVFNYEGVGAAQFIIALPVLFLPYVFYAPFLIWGNGNESIGLMLVGLVGLIGFLLRDKTIDTLTQAFTKKRHQIAAGFRAQ
jgi:hypothetical protein